MQYQAFTIHMEPRSLAALSTLLWAGASTHSNVVEAELKNLACEIDARLQKLPVGLEKKDDYDWL